MKTTKYVQAQTDPETPYRPRKDAVCVPATSASLKDLFNLIRIYGRAKEFDYDVATSGNKTDVVAAFVDACNRHGVMPGLYYCLEDYRNNSNYHGTGPMRAAYNLPPITCAWCRSN